MRTVLFIPALPRMSGGIAVLYQVAERLRELNLPLALTSTHSTAPGLVEMREAGFPVLPWDTLALSEDDCYLAPEGWPNALAPALKARARILVYIQNWAYLLSALPGEVSWRQLPVSFLAVSQPVAWFAGDLLGFPLAGILRPAVDTQVFCPGFKPATRVRIAWMPRKNNALAEQIRQIAKALLRRAPHAAPVEWVELHRMSREEVARALATCHIFLCTGFPEGIGLPPLEAMACGCLPVGFGGVGGWDYMRQGRVCGYMPQFPLRDVPWSGNGFFTADGDVIEAARALEEAVRLAACQAPALNALLAQGRTAAESYSAERQRLRVSELWSAFPHTLTARAKNAS